MPNRKYLYDKCVAVWTVLLLTREITLSVRLNPIFTLAVVSPWETTFAIKEALEIHRVPHVEHQQNKW